MAEAEPQRKDTKAPEGQTYEFYPLTGTKPIRLLYLEPSAENQALQYTLKAVDLSSEPQPIYNCLSYTWGYPQWEEMSPMPEDASPPGERNKRITCDNKTICVTDNLYFALTRLWDSMASIDKDTKKRMCIWIDAICIHQESNEERSSQVARMDEIYRHAQKVIVWLGPEHENYTSSAVDVLSRLSAVPVENHDASIPDGLFHPEIYRALGIHPIHDYEWVAFAELLMRTWFSRIWVIQETFEAREVVVYCGSHVLSWQQIVEVSKLLGATGLGWTLMKYLDTLIVPDEEEEGGGMEVDADIDGAMYMANTLNNQGLFEALREQKKNLKLETLLTYARYFGATNHSDYVYAVRGMWNPAGKDNQDLRESIKPDYDKSVEDVFTAAAFASAVEIGDLNILSLVEDNSLRVKRAQREYAACKKDPKRKDTTKHLPSWVPDWSITPIAETLDMNPRPEKGSERWKASKDLPYLPLAKLIEKRLHIQGVHITTIAEKASREPTFTSGIDDTQIFAALELLLNLLERSTSASSAYLINTFWRTIIKDTYRSKKADEAARKAFTSFLIVRIFELEKALIDLNPTSNSNSSLLEAPHTKAKAPSPNNSSFSKLEKLVNDIAARDGTDTMPTYQTVRKILEKEKANVEFEGLNKEDKFFAESFRLACVGRRLFATARDESEGIFLGIGPESLKKGDEVWVVAGANVPMVLRRQDKEWRLVGECYVHGIMEGEAVCDVSRGENIKDKKGGKQMVEIVLA